MTNTCDSKEDRMEEEVGIMLMEVLVARMRIMGGRVMEDRWNPQCLAVGGSSAGWPLILDLHGME